MERSEKGFPRALAIEPAQAVFTYTFRGVQDMDRKPIRISKKVEKAIMTPTPTPFLNTNQRKALPTPFLYNFLRPIYIYIYMEDVTDRIAKGIYQRKTMILPVQNYEK
jgi:hypothetical protein